MILCVVPEITDMVVRSAPTNVKLLDYKSFNSVEVHPFIATNTWDRIEVVVGKGIISGYIKQVLSVGNVVVARIPKDFKIDFETVSRISEIYPNVAAKIRKAYLQKQDIIPILKEEGAVIE